MEVAAIAAALEARVTPGGAGGGARLTFRREDVWYELRARETPHLELTMDAPDLAGRTLEIHLGRETLLGSEEGERVLDPRWWVRGPLDLLDEAPWPLGERAPRRRMPLVRRVVVTLVGALTGGVVSLGGAQGRSPSPRYVLTVADGRATIERRSSEVDPVLAVGAARRLVQLVTRPARRRAAVEEKRRAPRPWRPKGPPFR